MRGLRACLDLTGFLGKAAAGRPSLIALDFDGTLSPLVAHPGSARLSRRTRSLLRCIATGTRRSVAVVSGRSLADLRKRIRIPGLVYSGNHGLEIRGQGLDWTHPEAGRSKPLLHALARDLKACVARWPGLLLEDKGLSLSLHHRLAAAPARRAGYRALCSALAPYGRDLVLAEGKKVWEVRSRVDWDKGRAILRIARAKGAGRRILFVGDDRTDEEGFASLAGRAVTVRVGPVSRTAALHRLEDQRQVADLLELLCGEA
ncbi:MAG: trehalose-phosphatase [Elusimicrobia bacterium]|nr:trehalose-phosphatase [Elusimicrobiota bacterium]